MKDDRIIVMLISQNYSQKKKRTTTLIVHLYKNKIEDKNIILEDYLFVGVYFTTPTNVPSFEPFYYNNPFFIDKTIVISPRCLPCFGFLKTFTSAIQRCMYFYNLYILVTSIISLSYIPFY